jgi:hypothetical protein
MLFWMTVEGHDALFRLSDEDLSRQTDSGPCALLSFRDIRCQPAPPLHLRGNAMHSVYFRLLITIDLIRDRPGKLTGLEVYLNSGKYDRVHTIHGGPVCQ